MLCSANCRNLFMILSPIKCKNLVEFLLDKSIYFVYFQSLSKMFSSLLQNGRLSVVALCRQSQLRHMSAAPNATFKVRKLAQYRIENMLI